MPYPDTGQRNLSDLRHHDSFAVYRGHHRSHLRTVDGVGDQSHDDLSFPEPPEGLITAPDDRVVAQMDGQDSVAAAIDALAEAGFDREAIYVLCGPEGAKRLDVPGLIMGSAGGSTVSSSGSAMSG